MKIPQSFIEELKARIRVSEVVGRRVTLRRAGREFMGLCPFHKEKSPSFTVNDEKGFYHCFGCGAHGDVIGFLKDTESLSYPEAVERAAGMAGLSMPTFSRAELEREQRAEGQQQVVEAVCSWFEAQLEGMEGEIARRYLAERGITRETVERFRIGYAPENRDALTQAMQARGITPAQLIEAGVLIQVEGRAPYARFRRRLMFAIRDRKSRVVAFGGRVLPGEPNAEAPKYLNSPETPLFHKGRMLYNYDIARRAGMDAGRLIVCEGYMDVIALAQGGYAHAVAPLGTAITPEQLQLGWQTVDEPVLCLDGDAAGERAMLRAAHLALPVLAPGKSLRFARLPQGDDPDSMIRRGEQARFEEALVQAVPLADVVWRDVVRAPAGTPEAKAAQEQKLMQLAEQIKHPVVKQYYKSYFKELLWQRKKAKDALGAGLLPVANPEVKHVTALFLALIIRLPQLVHDGSAEERLLHLEVEDRLKPMYQSLIMILLQEPDVSSDDLIAALKEEHAKALADVLAVAAKQGLKEGLDHTELSMTVQHWWPFVLTKMELYYVWADIRVAEAELAEAMTEEHFVRLNALKARKDALEREVGRFYNQDPLSISG